MIFADSRYADGTILKAQDARTEDYKTAVYRTYPQIRTKFYTYEWVQGDRIDVIANTFLGSPSFWWRIMDLNPEIIDPFDVPIGTTIRIPSGEQ